MISFEDQIKNISKLKPRNSQAYYWFTHDLFIEEYKSFIAFATEQFCTHISNCDVQSFFDLFQWEDEKDFWKQFNHKQNSLMKYIVCLFNLQGDLSKPGNMFNYQKIKEIMFCDAKNEQGMLVYGLLKSIGKSYASPLYYYNVATALYYGDRNSLTELKLTSQDQYDMMESRIVSALQNSSKDVVQIDIFKMHNQEFIEEAIREFKRKK